ncbi:hypothetical protein FRB94_000115 [Tulasnella sp. JGI-2019a]|nr:hypothetical protein FRB94_000115 [Tulasnella sp. JGI-2019a]KAG9015799.1 hypothetical protein FRB93_012364 [Tulasnella sp. JGI-2019a]KAG9039569.1 hypothetical protein FRB95_009149 [Tulasnella sp. JGI-2019a]
MPNEQVTSELPPPAIKSPHQSLAPLEYLVNQRRGSITDPALFSAQQQQLHPLDQPSPPPRRMSNAYNNTRNGSYAFPATNGQKPHENSLNSNIDQSPDQRGGWTGQTGSIPPDQPMESSEIRHADSSRSGPPSFLPPPPFTGSKRKMSHDRQGFHHNPADDANGQSFGYAPHDLDGPQPKRRGSTFDTGNRIAHLSLQDRRDSVDSRSSVGGASIGGWVGDRRDSATSMYSTTSVASSAGGYGATGPGEPGKGSYNWSQQHQQHQQQHQSPHDSNSEIDTPRNFAFPQDPVSAQSNQQFALPPAPIIPSVHYLASAAAARRLSIPESSLPSNGVKPRNRRGSRNVSAFNSSATAPTTAAESIASPDTTAASMSPTTQVNLPADGAAGVGSPAAYDDDAGQLSGGGGSARKDTPYSRSPELRVSHKMAERKRRKEMKDLFDELRDQLPADRGMKASKWEILSKAVDYIAQLKVAYTEMSSEIEQLRAEVEGRPGGPSTTQARRHDFTSAPAVQDLATEPGTPVSAISPGSGSPMNGVTPGSQAGSTAMYTDRPSSAQSRRASVARSPSLSGRPLQQQLTGGGSGGTPITHSPFQSHHQTPQAQPNPLPLAS